MTKQTLLPLLLISTIFFTACSDNKQDKTIQKEIKAPTVTTEVITKKAFPIWIDFVGKSEAHETISVIARVQGRLEKIYFEAGQQVKKGDLLFEIEKTEYEATLEKAQGQLQSNKATLALAKLSVKRYKPLVKDDLAPKEKLDDLQAQQQEAQAAVRISEAEVKQAALNLSYCSVTASIDGVISNRMVDVGNIVGKSEENTILAVIVNRNPLYVYIHPSTEKMNKIQHYASTNPIVVKASTDKGTFGSDKSYMGIINYIDPRTNPSTGTVTVRAKINNDDYTLQGGMHVTLSVFVTDKIPVIQIDPKHLRQDQGGTYVFIVKEGKVAKNYVNITLQTNTYAIVKSGLSEGDLLITSGTQRLRKNMKVTVKKPSNDANVSQP